MMGKIPFILGLKISQNPRGGYSKVEKSKLDEDPQGKAVHPTHYRGMVGTLMYLTSSRPDLVYTYSKVSAIAITAFVDADHAGCQDTEEVHLEVCNCWEIDLIEYQLADIFTKALGRERIEFLIDKLRMRSFTPGTLKELTNEAEEIMTSKAQQIILDNAIVTPENQLKFKINNKRFSVNVEVFIEILNICPRILGQEFDEPLTKEEALSFVRELGHNEEIKYITNIIVDHLHRSWRTFASIINKCLGGKEDFAYQIDNKDSKKQDKMYYPRFTKAIIHHFLTKDKSISMRNRMFMHTTRDDNLLGTLKFVSRHKDAQVYGALLPEAMSNQAMLDSDSYKTYYAFATGDVPPKTKKNLKKSDSTMSSEETPIMKKPTKAKKDAPPSTKTASEPKPTKKKALIKEYRDKGLNVLSKIALSKGAQLKEATRRSKKDYHISHASGSVDGTDFELGVPNEQQRKTSGTDKGTGTKPWVPDVPKYDSDSKQESWGDSGEEDDDAEDDSGDEGDGDKGDDDDDDDDDDNDDDSDNERTVKDDAELTYAEQGGQHPHGVTQESGFEYTEKDAHVTITKTDDQMQSSSISSNFTSKMLNLKNISSVGNEITSLMDTSTIPLPPLPFDPLQQHATPTPAPKSSKATTLFSTLLGFSSVFKFNKKSTNLEKDLSEMRQVDQYAQAISLIPVIIDRYIDNKIGDVIKLAINYHAEECREEAQAEKRKYIDLVDMSSAHVEEPSHTIDSSREQDQKFKTGNYDEPSEGVTAPDWFKNPERSPTPDPDWNKRKAIDFRPPQTWISDIARAEKPPTSFDELMDTPINFFAFFMN
nr:hypothetical protein [Tanacetum cinerariifolium]